MPRLDLTWQQCEAMNIVRCECGHLPNNHFGHREGCAFCPCDKMKRVLVLPKKVTPKRGGER
jgi:hypothetical protein